MGPWFVSMLNCDRQWLVRLSGAHVMCGTDLAI